MDKRHEQLSIDIFYKIFPIDNQKMHIKMNDCINQIVIVSFI